MPQSRDASPPTNRRIDSFLLLLAAALVGISGLALAAPTPAKEVELLWQRHWRNYARRCIKLNDLHFACATFENQYPSSRGVTTIALRQKASREFTVRQGANVKSKRTLVPPNEEIEAGAKSLPDLSPGQYGYIHSAQIVEITGPDEMIVANLWTINPADLMADREKEKEKLMKQGLEKGDVNDILDWMFQTREQLARQQRDRSFRQPVKLRGFSTVGLTKGDRWTGRAADKDGVQIAIVGVESVEQESKRRKPVVMNVAVPADLFVRGISDEKQFLALLEARSFTREMFTTLVQEAKRLHGTDDKAADAYIFDKLDGRSAKDDAKDQKAKPRERTKPSF